MIQSIKAKFKNEDGAVLITSLLLLMVVTVLAVVGMQAPKTDILISGNEKFSVQSRQLANLGVMEAKNWLSLRYKPDSIPLNAATTEDIFIVARPDKDAVNDDENLDNRFSRIGIQKRSSAPITITQGENFNSPDSGATFGKVRGEDDYTVRHQGVTLGEYEWNIIRLSENIGAADTPESATLLPTYLDDKNIKKTDGTETALGKFLSPIPITNGYNAAIGEDKAFWQYFYINGKGYSNGIISESEAVASYKQIIPSSD